MTRWCIECAQQQQHQAATKTVDGDPLCDFHAKKAGESGGETEPVTPAPAKKPRGPYRKRVETAEPPAKKPRGPYRKRVETAEPPAKKPRGPYRKRVETAEPPAPALELLKHEPEVAPPAPSNADRVLWKARLSIQQRKDEFLFRASEEFSEASTIATDLLDSSPSCQMVGAVIVGIERVARLWN
jgi:hypothetical protein